MCQAPESGNLELVWRIQAPSRKAQRAIRRSARMTWQANLYARALRTCIPVCTA